MWFYVNEVKLTGLVIEVNVAKVTDFSKIVVNVVKGTGLVVLVNEVKTTVRCLSSIS